MPAITLDSLTFTWPDGTTALSQLTGTIDTGATGIIGRNGSGKSTLLRLIAGELTSTDGTVTTSGAVAYLPQTITHDPHRQVSDLLGVEPALSAIRQLEAGDASPAVFDRIGDEWDIEERAVAALAEAGFGADVLDRTLAELSGGEVVLVALAGIRRQGAPITVLDEPTNNLDLDARRTLLSMISGWPGTLVVASHDAALLELMGHIAELYGGRLRTFTGGYSVWRAAIEAEQLAARNDEREASKAVRRERRQRIEAEHKLATRAKIADKAEREKRVPKIISHNRRGQAQVSTGRLRVEMRAKEAIAQEYRDAADERIRRDATLHIVAPDPEVAASRRILSVGDGERTWIMQGSERMAIIGPNGAGKSTLLARLRGKNPPIDSEPTGHRAHHRADRRIPGTTR